MNVNLLTAGPESYNARALLYPLLKYRKAISDSDLPTAGIVGGVSAIARQARKMFPTKEINLDDLRRLISEMRKNFTEKRDEKILERAEAGKGMKAGGLVKGKKKSVKSKKPSKAGRLAKRGYGAARK